MQLAVSTSQSHAMMRRRKNVWYSACDGNWSDPNTWISNALDKKLITVPQAGDDVVINHSVNFDEGPSTNTIVDNLFISGKLTATNNLTTLTVKGNLQATGFIDFTGSNVTLNLNGLTNSAIYSNFTAGNSTINYCAPYNDQPILNLPYKNLSTSAGVGIKYMTSDLTIAGTFNVQSNFECNAYNLTVNGTSTIGSAGAPYRFTKKSPIGLLLFIGNVDFDGITDLSVGNPNVECRGGIVIHTFNLTTGTGTWTFSTNSQTINCSAYLGGIWSAPVVVSGAIIVTLTGSAIWQVSSLDGTVSGSTFNNEGVLYLGANFTPMTTGVFNYNHLSTSTIGYVFNGTVNLPQTSFSNLVIGGTGTKTQGGNTVVSGNFTNNGAYECGGYNLTVTGAFTNATLFTASSFCTIMIGGFASFSNSGTFTNCMDLRTGNPNVEFKNGLDIHAAACYTGTGTFKFSTNDQALSFSAYNGGICAANFLISGAITLTFTNGSVIPDFLGTLNGDNASSTFDNRGIFAYTNATAPMATGKLYCNQSANTFNYDLAGGQDVTVPSDPTPGYKNLILSGSGAKRLLGTISVKGTYTLTLPATLDSNGFSLTNP